jgi:hypothetical protein
MIENKLSPVFNFKLASAEASGLFAGYGSTFGGEPDSYGDVIAPGAFSDSLKRYATSNAMPALLWAHDPSEPIGKWLPSGDTAVLADLWLRHRDIFQPQDRTRHL